jgi:hypothetical protein
MEEGSPLIMMVVDIHYRQISDAAKSEGMTVPEFVFDAVDRRIRELEVRGKEASPSITAQQGPGGPK